MSDEAENAGNEIANCSILLVEDNVINQKVVKLMLGKFDINPAIADSGAQAIEVIKDRKFDLVLMDLHMPGMDGVEAAGYLHEYLGEACPPIVALTADSIFSMDGNIRKTGFSGFLTKPVNADTLRQCIHEQTTFR